MKLSTSIRNAMTVAERIKRCNGLIGTPEAITEAFRIKRAWVFGSTAKGNPNPNDTDILIEGGRVGRFNPRRAKKQPKSKSRMGIRYRVESIEVACAYLVGNLKMIRLHDIMVDGNLGDIPDTKIMIYPRNDLPKAI